MIEVLKSKRETQQLKDAQRWGGLNDIAGIDVSILGVVTHVRNILYNRVSSGCAVTRPAPTVSLWHRLHCRHDPHQRPSDVCMHSWICNMNVTRVKPRMVQVQI